jgi:hypothetical protein
MPHCRMHTYVILPGGTTPETWVIERVINYAGQMEPLVSFDTRSEAEEALSTILARKALREL